MVGSPSELPSDPALDRQLMQFNQCRYRDARHAERHSGAGDGIQHPRGQHDDRARRPLDVDDLAAGALFDILATDSVPTKSGAAKLAA
jgi:hypothetical protein